jgi:hypothetical protein
MGRVVVMRRSLKVVARGKPTVGLRWKAAVLDARWRGCRTPPGSESGAGSPRGHSGTGASHLPPGYRAGMGERRTNKPWRDSGLPPGHEPMWETTHAGSEPGIGARATREGLRDGPGGRRSGALSRGRWGSEAQATHGRERSETSYCTCRCESCRRNSPFGAVVISGSPLGDRRAGSPDVKALGRLRTRGGLGLISPGGEQPGGP